MVAETIARTTAKGEAVGDSSELGLGLAGSCNSMASVAPIKAQSVVSAVVSIMARTVARVCCLEVRDRGGRDVAAPMLPITESWDRMPAAPWYFIHRG